MKGENYERFWSSFWKLKNIALTNKYMPILTKLGELEILNSLSFTTPKAQAQIVAEVQQEVKIDIDQILRILQVFEHIGWLQHSHNDNETYYQLTQKGEWMKQNYNDYEEMWAELRQIVDQQKKVKLSHLERAQIHKKYKYKVLEAIKDRPLSTHGIAKSINSNTLDTGNDAEILSVDVLEILEALEYAGYVKQHETYTYSITEAWINHLLKPQTKKSWVLHTLRKLLQKI